MRLLGIETSCDETSCAVVENGRNLLSQVILSQETLHRPFKGVVPEIASRAHLENINSVLEKLIKKFGKEKMDAVAVTIGPGLVGSLLVGKMAAESLGWVWNIPVVGINHLEAHLFSPMLANPSLNPPFLGFIVSGGHTDLVLVKDFGKYHVLGRTRDDSCGESFDKVASLLNLGYPGGPIVDRLSKRGKSHAIPFPRPFLKGTWDFSFSGLKTAVLYYLRDHATRNIYDICASFQSAVVDVLIYKAVLAAKKFNLKKISVGGGVSANSELRERFLIEARKNGVQVFFPSQNLSTDNAAMIASLGFYKYRHSGKRRERLDINPSLPILNWR